jgi:hypothetical protein
MRAASQGIRIRWRVGAAASAGSPFPGQERLSDQLRQCLTTQHGDFPGQGCGAPLVQRHGGHAGLSGMIRGARPRSPLVPQVWLERGRAHNLTRQWPLDLLRRAAVLPSRLRLARTGMKGLKARPQDGVVCDDSCNASPVPLHPCHAPLLGCWASTSPETPTFTADPGVG